ncbi:MULTISPECIES: signal peptide peptidase SppA [Nitrosomonas]|uniref:Signal peptide peptidase SppA n=3 Tax=Nitrosomonas communis TaxID=44574 RepID=A0A5D3Y6T9_9PROT|nr:MULTISPECIES: signal peptide peptidase SppA [Nitrosomonas]TYP72343.1 signal peptide peptidase SppA [Nitrosomonas communis]UVS61330.1 signal peptide peptidase SppA [Nitrosomonas sp. PLL12]
MQITDVLTSPWAIVPEKLLEIHAIYDARVKGERIDLAAVEARIGKPLANENQGYQINNGVAVIPIHGVIAKKMNMFDAISGGVSTQLVARDIRAAVDDPAVKSILLHIDSPGGTVDGTQTLANLVKEASAIKPVMTFADGVMASAAYWIGSAASEIVSSGDTTQIGSIGVVTTHKDISKAEEKSGVKTTEISAGKYKRIASQFSPLSEEAQAHLQDQVDQLYTIFVDSVAENRDVSSDVVLEQMADGRVFLSKEALKRGMIDHIATFEQTITNMQNGV